MASGVIPDADLRALLRRICGDGELRFLPLGGGLHGRCFRAVNECCDLALRLPSGVDPGPFRLPAETERRIIAVASAAGLSPSVVELPGDTCVLATRFLASARAWSAADARRTSNIDRIASTLRALHALEIELPPYRGQEAAVHYAQSAGSALDLGSSQRAWRDEMLRLAERFLMRYPAVVPCHNDLVASNILDGGELSLVDFEYAAASSPILDIAGYAALNGLDLGGRTRLVDAYYADRRAPFDADELEAAVRLIRLLAYFWSLTQAGSDDADAAASDFADSMAAMLR